ncbi:MAG: nucleoside-triphosphatase [Candidatus Aenigmatarchaeota archaeon]
MKIFISGLPRTGKTTLCKEIYEKYKEKIKISGFLTLEKRDGNKRDGFEIFELKNKKLYLFASREKISNICYAGYYLNLEVLEKVIEEVKDADLVIIDEIGKMEMMSQKFSSFINSLIKSDKNLLATLHRSFINNFKNFGKIYWLTRENYNQVLNEIENQINKIMGR